ncbi:hypothetical protein BKA65DRAFT_575695 [Rhexocercosporidium sp. MPI-PUGE-AT-0058]|nr:hypothetical protein BKA65DRAFT_575695 [Rhexocercosporidium sp. MPI-PUGE-AT-0058]
MIPPAFSSMDEAGNSLECIRATAARNTPAIRPTIPAPLIVLLNRTKMAKIIVALELRRSVATLTMPQWDSVLSAFILNNSKKLDALIKQAIFMLRVHKTLMSISFSFNIDSIRALHDETAWDDFELEFKNILSLTEEFLDSFGEKGSIQVSFNFDLGVVYPLWFVAVKC